MPRRRQPKVEVHQFTSDQIGKLLVNNLIERGILKDTGEKVHFVITLHQNGLLELEVTYDV